jgi:hypothetical protein
MPSRVDFIGPTKLAGVGTINANREDAPGCQGFTEPVLSPLRYKTTPLSEVNAMQIYGLLRKMQSDDTFFTKKSYKNSRKKSHLLQGQRIDAVAQARRRWAIGEDMPQMGIAGVAPHFYARHAVAVVHMILDGVFLDG